MRRRADDFSTATMLINIVLLVLLTVRMVSAVVSTEESLPTVAVCVSGQATRWMPHYLVEGLLEPNENFRFSLFFNIQAGSSQPIHSSGIGFAPTKMAAMNHPSAIDHLSKLLAPLKQVETVSLQYYRVEDLDYWVKVVQGPLDRFKQKNMHHGTSIGVNIMNMYHAHVNCAQQIEDYERQQGGNGTWKFDYLVSTREDAYLYTPLNLTRQVQRLRPDVHAKPNGEAKCDIVYRECLSWGGLNMRMQVMNRDAGLLMLGKRFVSYKQMRDGGWKPFNPEQFELFQTMLYNLEHCAVPVAEVPITAARHVANDSICFYEFERKDCYPQSVAKEAMAVPACEEVEHSFSAGHR